MIIGKDAHWQMRVCGAHLVEMRECLRSLCEQGLGAGEILDK